MTKLIQSDKLEKIITVEDSIKFKNLLESKDKFGMLSQSFGEGDVWEHYLWDLATIYAIADKFNVPLEKTTIFEFGAHHHTISIHTNFDPHNPCFAHFFILSSNQQYYAIDIAFSEKILEFALKCTKEMVGDEYWAKRSAVKPYINVDLNKLKEGIKNINLEYKTAEKRIYDQLKKNQSPLIISNNVLNDPDLNIHFKYWKLPGFHVHISDKEEIESKIGVNIAMEPQSTPLSKFKNYFGLDIEINFLELKYPHLNLSSMVYFWNNNTFKEIN